MNKLNQSTEEIKDVDDLTGTDIEAYLPSGEVHFLAGRSGAGKTHFAFQALNMFRNQLGRILYVTLDRSARSAEQLFAKLKIENPWGLVSLVDENADTSIEDLLGTRETDDHYFRHIRGYIEDSEHPPDTVVIDPAQLVIPCRSLNAQKSVAHGLSILAAYARQDNLRIILLWHVNKMTKRDLNDVFDRMSGSHALQAYSSTKIFLEVPGTYEGQNSPIFLYIRGQLFEELKIELRRLPNGTFRLANELDEICLRYPVYRLLTREAKTRAELIADAQNSSDPGLHNLSSRTIDRQLSRLVELGLAERPVHGQYRRAQLIVSLTPA